MKMLVYILVSVLLGVHSLYANPSDELITSLVQVESRGNSNAIGDNGKAIGCLQIHKGVVEDVNRIYGTTYVHSDCKNVEISKEICRKYLTYYGGKSATDEKYARIWNGGPRGHLKTKTKGYWIRVRDIMTRQIYAMFSTSEVVEFKWCSASRVV